MVDEPLAYQFINTVGGRDVVIATRANFPKAIADDCLPFDVEEINLVRGSKAKLEEGSVVLLVKSFFPRSRLERIKCLQKN
jgi:hypothetical protein